MKYYFLGLLFILNSLLLKADIKSTRGEISFDRNSDGQSEMDIKADGIRFGAGDINSSLQFNGTLGYDFSTTSANLNLNDSSQNVSFIFADSSSDNLEINLPYAGNVKGRSYTIKKTSSLNNVWIRGGGNYIDQILIYEMCEQLNQALPEITFLSNGLQWYSLHKSADIQELGSSNLVLWHKHDLTAGATVSDTSLSGDDNEGTLVGTTYSDNTTLAKVHRGLNFDGTDDYVDIPDSNSLDINKNITICLWFNIDSYVNTFPTLYAKGTGNYRLFLTSATQKIQVRFTGLSYINSDYLFVTNEWYHVVVTFNGTDKKIYINGTLDTHDVEVGSITTNNADFVVGNFDEAGARSFKGAIDDFRVYNKALDSQQILALYQANL